MQFLPTKNEEYVSALRKYMHKNILCRGVNAKRLETLRKIYLFDLCITSSAPNPTDTLIFFRNLLTACTVELVKKGIFLTVDLEGGGIRNFDTKLLTALVGEVLVQTVVGGGRNIRLSIGKNEIRITSKGEKLQGYPLKLIKKLGGRYLILGNTNAISIPAFSTQNTEISENGDIKELLLDPLSPVKVYLSPIRNRYFL